MNEIEQLANDLKMNVKSLNKTLAVHGYDHAYDLWTKKEINDSYKSSLKYEDHAAIEILKKLLKNRKIFDKVKNLLLTRKIERNPRRHDKDVKFLNWIVQFEKHIDKIITSINNEIPKKDAFKLYHVVSIEKYPSIPKYVYEKMAYIKLLLYLYEFKVEHYSSFSKNKILIDFYNQLLNINKTTDEEMQSPLAIEGLIGPEGYITSWYNNLREILEMLDHFYDLSANVQEFYSFNWMNYSPKDLIAKLTMLERKLEGKTSQTELQKLYKEEEPYRKLYLNTSNPNLKWFFTTQASPYECYFMKHCGSTKRLFNGEFVSILSLREYDPKLNIWLPQVTAMSHSIANNDNNHLKSPYYKFSETTSSDYYQFLTEIKGRRNELPDEKYWKYILELFHDERILFQIVNHGYKPENNFSIYKLPKLSLKNFVSSSKGYFFDKISKLKPSPLWSHHVELLDQYNERVHVKKDKKKKDKKLLKELLEFPEERTIVPPKIKKKVKRK